MRENNSGFKIDESQRQSWLSIAAVWAGGMICVPCLMIGGVLAGGGLSLGQIVLSILIGYGLICAYMICIGMQACDTGLPVSVMASGALGEKGARYIISTLLAIACVGWFGIQSATCGSAFASMVANMLGTEASPVFVSISSIVWGVIMLLTACVGFKGLKWLNYIAVPLLVIVCLYGLIAGITTNDGGSAIANYAPENSSGMVFGISMVVASFALGGVISADYCRFAKSRADVVKSSIVGVIPAGLFMLLMAIAAEKEVDLPPLQRHEQICGKSVLNDVFFICSAVSVFHVSPPYSSDLFVGQNGCPRRISAPWENCAWGRLCVVISVTADIS